jgi:hypothetical protein
VTSRTYAAVRSCALTVALACAAAAVACRDADSLAPGPDVQLSLSDSSLTVGDSGRATVTVDGTRPTSLRWSSSDGAVLAVDSEGRYRAVAAGRAILTAKSASSARVYAQLAVMVHGPGTHGCRYEMIPPGLSLAVGATADLRNAVSIRCAAGPTGPWRWESMDTTIATVTTDGIVTARGAGITGLLVSSSTPPDRRIGGVWVAVSAGVCTGCTGPVTPSFVSLVLGQSAQLQIAGLASDSARARAYSFTSSNPSVATVSPAGLVTTGGGVGLAVITVALRSEPRISYPVAVSVTIPRGVRLSIWSIVGAADSLPVSPDSVAGEIIVSLDVDRRPGVARTLRLSLVGAGGDSLTASAELPASSEAGSPIVIVPFRVNTAVRDASGRLRLPNGPYDLVVRILEGAAATQTASIQTRLTLRNAP